MTLGRLMELYQAELAQMDFIDPDDIMALIL